MTFEELIRIPIEEARGTWSGTTGDKRAEDVESFIRRKVTQYSERLDMTPLDLLIAFQKTKYVNAPNYYQEANFPNLDGVTIFETAMEFRECFPSCRYICPSCKGISNHHSICDSGILVNGKPCDWKAFGLFGTLGEGFRFLVKEMFLEKAVVYDIFKPIELVEGKKTNDTQ